MRLVRNTLLGLGLAAVAAMAAVDPALLNLIPQDAKIVSGMQVDQSKASKFGQYVLTQITSDDADMQKFITETGFDPRRDLSEIVVATAGTTPAPEIIAVGRGVFNPAKILNAATAAGATVTTYKGFQLITDKNSKGEHALAFLDASTAAMGTTAAVQATIDRRNSGSKLDPVIQAKIVDLSNANHAWFLSTVPVSDFFSGKMAGTDMGQAAGGNLFQAIRSAQGGVKFTSTGIQISGEALARSDQDATALADVIRFVAGLVAQNKEQNPQAAKAATLLDSMQLSTQASTLKISLMIPEALAEQLFMPAKKAASSHHKAVASLH